MKLQFLLLLLFFVHAAHAQTRDANKTRQIEHLQQIKQTITRRIDTLHLQLSEQLISMEDTRRKLDQLRKESSNHDKPDASFKDQESKLSQELSRMNTLAGKLQKQYDQQLLALDKAFNLQHDLEDKIVALVRENNQ